MQYSRSGSATRRSASTESWQDTQTPYVPRSMRSRAASTSRRSRFTCSSPGTAVAALSSLSRRSVSCSRSRVSTVPFIVRLACRSYAATYLRWMERRSSFVRPSGPAPCTGASGRGEWPPPPRCGPAEAADDGESAVLSGYRSSVPGRPAGLRGGAGLVLRGAALPGVRLLPLARSDGPCLEQLAGSAHLGRPPRGLLARGAGGAAQPRRRSAGEG